MSKKTYHDVGTKEEDPEQSSQSDRRCLGRKRRETHGSRGDFIGGDNRRVVRQTGSKHQEASVVQF